MRRKILIILFIANTMMISVYDIPFLQQITHVFFNREAASIGIIGGADGPTAIYIASQINWFPIIVFSIEIALGLYLFLTRSKKITSPKVRTLDAIILLREDGYK